MLLGLDLETASQCDLKLEGAHRYSLHPSTIVRCAVIGWMEGTEFRYVTWQQGDPPPACWKDVQEALAFNSTFERSLVTNVLARQGWDVPARWLDPQAAAAAANLPTSLGGLAHILGCAAQKDKDGSDLAIRMSKLDEKGFNRHDTPENRAKLLAYCIQDVRTMFDCWARVPKMTATEAALWQLDQKINQRGIYIDQQFVDRLRSMAERRKQQLDFAAREDTDLDALSAASTPRMKSWLASKGMTLPVALRATGEESESIGRQAVLGMLENAPPDVRRVLENRLEASKATSLAKLKRVGSLIDPRDGRLKNALQFCGAHTGRWASRGLQVHNLPRDKRPEEEVAKVRALVEAGDLPGLAELVDRPLEALSQSLRGIIGAPPGRELIGADFSAIEARVCAWLAGQHDLVERFAVYDSKSHLPKAEQRAFDPYLIAAANSGSSDRDFGKFKVLSCQYSLGTKMAFEKGTEAKLKEWTRKSAYQLIRDFRKENAAIVAFWSEAERAFKDAIRTPRKVFTVGRWVKVASNGGCLLAQLPSGRVMRYWRPGLRTTVKSFEVIDENGELTTTKPKPMEEITFWAPAKNAISMQQETTYGGSICENLSQAVARDVLGHAMPLLEAAGYPLSAHVHDSVLTEVATGDGSISRFCEIATTVPSWAPGLPLAASGYRDTRFRG